MDLAARMDVDELTVKLTECLATQTPVYMVVAIMGSTEQGAIDPLDSIISIRTKFQALGLSFEIHADGAWGGYFASIIRAPPGLVRGPNDPDNDFVPDAPLSPYVITQISAYADADSITIDPHK